MMKLIQTIYFDFCGQKQLRFQKKFEIVLEKTIKTIEKQLLNLKV